MFSISLIRNSCGFIMITHNSEITFLCSLLWEWELTPRYEIYGFVFFTFFFFYFIACVFHWLLNVSFECGLV